MFAGQGRAPEIRNGSEVEEAADQLRDILYQAVDAEETDEEDGTGRRGMWGGRKVFGGACRWYSVPQSGLQHALST